MGNITHKPIRFVTPPKTNYAVYFISDDYSGPDEHIMIADRTLRIELYTKHLDDEDINTIKKNLIELGIEFQQFEPVWLNTEKLYLNTYILAYTFKIKEENQ